MRINTKALLLPLSVAMMLTACQQPSETQAEQPKSAETAPATTEQAKPEAKQVSVDLSAESAAYHEWVKGEIDALLSESQQFVQLLKEGKLEEAKAAYPKARVHFERSEPVAEVFGDLDPRIDNRKADLEQGEKWTGFHAIEEILWTKNTTEGTQELADQLIADIKELQSKIPSAKIDGKLMIEGAVDLLNEVSTTKITGEEEIFSKTDLHVFQANVEGANKIFEILTPKLTEKDPALVKEIEGRFKDVYQLLDKHKENGNYKSYDKLSADDTKQLAEAITKLGEPLAKTGQVLQ